MPTPQSPEWWTERLWNRLQDRRKSIKRFEDYYDGDAPYPWMTDQLEEAYREVKRLSRSNYMGLVVDATYERLKVVGFRRGGQADEWAWRTWQGSNMDRWSPQAMKQAVLCGTSYVLVAPREDRRPRMTVEHPAQAIVEHVPGDPEARAAGLRAWAADRDGEEVVEAVLYLPDATHFLRGAKGSAPADWSPRKSAEENPYEVVPLLEMPNDPDLFNRGRSEIRDVIDIQDRVNKTIMDRIVTQDFGAFPQKYAEGWPEELDEEGRTAEEQGAGQHPDAVRLTGDDGDQPPVHMGRNRLLIAPTGVEFGQFDVAPMDPYSAAKREDVKDISARTRIPPHFLLGDIANMSAEALIAAESGLVAKVNDRKEPFADTFEEAVRLAYRMDDSGTAPTVSEDDLEALETLWADVEFRSIAQVMDAWGKAVQMLGVPVEAAWSRIGAEPQEVERWKTMEIERSRRTVGTDIAGLLGGDVPAAMDADEIAKRANAAGILIRSGFEPDDALQAVGLDPIEHGLLPVTVQKPPTE